jgi:Ca2+/H+ antiporter
MAENSSSIGTVAVSVMPVLDEEAMTALVAAMTQRIKVAINRAICEAVQITVAERAGAER